MFNPEWNPNSDTDEELMHHLSYLLATGIDIFDEMQRRADERREFHRPPSAGAPRLTSRALSIARTHLETAGLWLVSELANEQGSSLQDGLRGI